jgi:hypothetical protein
MSYWIAGAATVGALMDKKKPLRGAMMGATVGATGGAALGAGGLLGGGAAATGAATGAGAGAAATGGAAGTAGFGLGQPLVTGTMGSSAMAGGSAAGTAGSGGMMSGLLNGATKYKPIMDAAGTGLAMSGAMEPEQPMQVPEMAQMGGGGQTLTSLANQGQQGAMASIQAGEQERARRRMQRGFS